MSDDARRYADELERCHRLSLDVVRSTPGVIAQMRRARYHAERVRVFKKIGVTATVAFLREETLQALAGKHPQSAVERWFALHALEFGGPVATSTVDLMDEGVRKLVRDDIAHAVVESSRAAQGVARRQCPDCDNWGCEGGGCV